VINLSNQYRTEEYPTIVESYARECPNGKREKKRICKALPKDGYDQIVKYFIDLNF
jgi:hypothetical protein